MNKREGKGKYIYENGDYYVGDFVNGLYHGNGIEYYKNGNIRYEGEFKDNLYDGKGKYCICRNTTNKKFMKKMIFLSINFEIRKK
jgi:hypothetical protein